jgi:hypothetical protein
MLHQARQLRSLRTNHNMTHTHHTRVWHSAQNTMFPDPSLPSPPPPFYSCTCQGSNDEAECVWAWKRLSSSSSSSLGEPNCVAIPPSLAFPYHDFIRPVTHLLSINQNTQRQRIAFQPAHHRSHGATGRLSSWLWSAPSGRAKCHGAVPLPRERRRSGVGPG